MARGAALALLMESGTWLHVVTNIPPPGVAHLARAGYEVTHPADPAPDRQRLGNGAFPWPNTPKNPFEFDVGCVSTEPLIKDKYPANR
jgi:hypothetical protein